MTRDAVRATRVAAGVLLLTACGGGANGRTPAVDGGQPAAGEAIGLAREACEELAARWADSTDNMSYFNRAARLTDAAAQLEPTGYVRLAADIKSRMDAEEAFDAAIASVDPSKMERALDDIGELDARLAEGCPPLGVTVPTSE